MKIELNVSNGFQQIVTDGKFTNLAVNTRKGYQIYRREPGFNEIDIASRCVSLLGKRIVQVAKREGQITEADFLAEVGRAIA